MMRRLILLGIAAFAAATIYYVSRFWDFRLWGREGLFYIESLRPQGGLVGMWLRGTPFGPFELLIWLVGVFLALTFLQKMFDKFSPRDGANHEDHL